MTEDEVPRARVLMSAWTILFGTVPPLRARFSSLSNAVLGLLRSAVAPDGR
jgi:hypothetical protein